VNTVVTYICDNMTIIYIAFVCEIMHQETCYLVDYGQRRLG